MKKILVTGATGFIGSHCIPLLLERNYEVYAISSKDINIENDIPNLKWQKANLLDHNQIRDLMSHIQPTHLLHYAWFCKPGTLASSVEDNLLWVQSSLEILRQFNKYGGKRIVMTGSCNEYDWNYGYCSEFITPKLPNTIYGVCKHSLQTLYDRYTSEVELSSAWARLFFIYGPHEEPSRLVASVIRSILQSEPALCSHGKQIRDYIYIKDVADALVTLLDSDVIGPVNIGSGNPIALKDIIYTIAEKLNAKELIQLGALPAAKNDTPLITADVKRLYEEVGWQPSYDLDQGLDESISWWKEQIESEKN